MKQLWTTVDAYFEGRLIPEDPALSAAIEHNAEAGLPPHDVAPNQGKFLHLLARAIEARRILEIGTLGGYSTIWLARALPKGGHLVTLELEERHAEVARANLARAGFAEVVELIVGPAASSMDALIAGGCAPFDLVFIDADKPSNVAYLERALRLSRAGTLIVADNVVREGAVVEERSEDRSVQGVRQFLDAVAENPRLDAAALQTVGAKGWDGFALILVKEAG